eukprot:TRINITY_DN3462_c0_g1_i1.p1 TRINITY_DN3462_c0_g1~~TRINITY_DN3462_c0_g1_i1.p1  ORF type:complete len:231 (+),score=67.71 TRINITY_DN3462_c0_g1_i1:51-743(+)
MGMFDSSETVEKEVAEMEKFLENAKHSKVKAILESGLKTLRTELRDAKQMEEETKKKEANEAARAAKEAEEEEARKQKAAEREEKKKVKCSGRTTKGGLVIEAEAAEYLHKMKTLGRNAKDTACLTEIASDGATLKFVDFLEDTTIEDIADELTELDPKFIFYSYTKTMPDGRVKTPLVFIFYSPQKAPPKKLMAATKWKLEVSKEYELVKTLEIRDLDDFDQDWFDSVS